MIFGRADTFLVARQMDDWQLLEQYRRSASQQAFAQLVQRHVGLVYHVCRRRLRDADLAEDVTQAVFVVLARRAPCGGGATLAGWLYRTALHACANADRARLRRLRHERVAAQLRQESSPLNEQVHPSELVLDEAISALSAADRNLVLMRFYEDRDHEQIGNALGVSSNTAAKRLSRAVLRMRRFLASRGSDLPAASIGPLLIETLSRQAPAQLVERTTSAVLAQAAPPAIETIARGVIQMLVRTKLKIITTTIGCVILGGGIISMTALLAQQTPAAKPQASVSAPATQPSASPKQVMRQFAAAIRKGDARRLRELVHCANRDEQSLVSAVCDYVAASAEFKHAIGDKFGPDGLKQMQALFELTPVDRFALLIETGIDNADEAVSDDEAVLQTQGSDESFILVKNAGEWKISATRMTETWTPEQWQSRHAEVVGAAEAVQMLAQKVSEGGYASVEELKREVGSFMNQRR